jgi:hypothetical protein
LKREWLFEQRDGTCPLMPALAARLGETALKWRAEVALNGIRVAVVFVGAVVLEHL